VHLEHLARIPEPASLALDDERLDALCKVPEQPLAFCGGSFVGRLMIAKPLERILEAPPAAAERPSMNPRSSPNGSKPADS
jgi:hypothetical protein